MEQKLLLCVAVWIIVSFATFFYTMRYGFKKQPPVEAVLPWMMFHVVPIFATWAYYWIVGKFRQ